MNYATLVITFSETFQSRFCLYEDNFTLFEKGLVNSLKMSLLWLLIATFQMIISSFPSRSQSAALLLLLAFYITKKLNASYMGST